jgi:anti-sigma factor RsiW
VNNPDLISDDDLHAYIDGVLEEERARKVRDALSANAALAERVALFQADKAMLKAIYAPLVDLPLPSQWIARARQKRRTRWRLAYAAAAAVLLIVAAGSLAWRFHPPGAGIDVVETALDARQNSSAGEHLTVSDGQRTAQYDAALRQVISSDLHVPNLSRMGYTFSGLHLYDKAAEILYRGPGDQLFTVYVRRSDGSTRFDQFKRGGLRVCIWQDDQISIVMAGDISAAAMQRLATLSYAGLMS